MRRVCWLLLSVPLLLQTTMRGQDVASLTERLHAADAGSALDTADVKPWHLKMTVQLFNQEGGASDQGTIEEWWNSPELDRREYKTKGYTATEIRSGGKLYRTAGTDLPPYYLELLRRQVAHPISLPEQAGAELHKVNIGKVALDCIELRSAGTRGPSTLGFFPTYCVESGGAFLRITLDYSMQEIVRTLTGQFQGKEVAVDAVVKANRTKVAALHVDSLSGGAVPEGTFAATAGTPEVVPPILSSGDLDKVVRGSLLSGAGPVFPAMAKAQHAESGIVLLRAIITANGGVRSVAVISSTNPVFEGAAMDAVRQWKYKSSTRDGLPMEVESVIVVRFSMANL